MKALKWVGLLVLVLAALPLLAGQLGWLRGKPPRDIGVHDGRLAPPSLTPNSVSSQADLWPDHPQRDYARIAPLALRGDGTTTMARLKALVEATPGVQIVDSRPDYLYAQFSTRVLKFVDDAEFWFDPAAGVVQLRSSSRIGRKDFGVNRARIETLRAQLAAGG